MTDMGGPAPCDADARLQVLLVEYEGLRDDERASTTLWAALAGTAVALLLGFGAAIYRGDLEGPTVGLLLLPLAPYALVSYALVVGAAATLRSFYLRAIEREIAVLAPGQLAVDPWDEQQRLHGPSYTHLIHSIGSQTNGFRSIQILYAALWSVIFLLLSVVSIGGALSLQPELGWTSVLAAGFYAALTVMLMIPAHAVTFGGHQTWIRALAAMDAHWQRELGIRPTGVPLEHRTKWSYVLLPRPKEWIKWVFVPVGLAMGSALHDGPAFSLPTIIVAVLAFEYLLYQARYTWNDLRDGPTDLNEPGRAKERIPPGGERAATFSMLLRVMAWLVVCVLTWPSVGPSVLASGAAAVLLAIPYERARDSTHRQGGWTSEATRSMRAVYFLVGGGYSIRVVLGLWLGAGPRLEWPIAIYALVAAWALGTAFVVMTWTIDSCKFLLEVPADSGVMKFDQSILQKGHVMPLLWASGILKQDPEPYEPPGEPDEPDEPETAQPTGGPGKRGGEHEPHTSQYVTQGNRCPLKTVESWGLWSVCGVISSGAIAGMALADPRLSDTSPWLLAVVASGILVAAVAGRASLPNATRLLFTVLVALLAARIWSEGSDPLFGWLTFAPALVLLGFRGASQVELSRDLTDRMGITLRGVIGALDRLERVVRPKPRPLASQLADDS